MEKSAVTASCNPNCFFVKLNSLPTERVADVRIEVESVSKTLCLRISDMFKGVVPYIILQLIGISLITLFPKIALWLPEIMIGFAK